MTGGEHGYISKPNLEYLLDTVKDVGERLHRKQAIAKKDAYLLYNVVVLHPFLNGNKRTAYELVKLFLQLNGFEIDSTPGEAYHLLLDIASGKVSAADVDRWVAINLAEVNQK
jgi:death-on-curing protein